MPKDLDENYAWAAEMIGQYHYRERFGLSYEEFLREPFELYRANQTIGTIIADQMNKKTKLSKARGR